MPNRCLAAGCSNVPDPSKSIGLHKLSEDNDSKRKRRRLWIAFVGGRNVQNDLPQMHHAYVHNVLKPMISKAYLLQFQEKGCCIPCIHSQKAEPSNVENDVIAVQICTRQRVNVSKIEQICTCYISVFTSYCF